MLHNKMLAVIGEINAVVAEREEVAEAIAIALLTRKNLFILGDTGQAKSQIINEFRRRIVGAKQFERLLSKQADEEQLFGRIDLSSLIPGNPNSDILAGDAEYQRLLRELETAVDTDELLRQIEARRRMLYALHGSTPRLVTTGKIPDSHLVFLDEIFKANDGILNALLTALNERKFTNEGETAEIPTISFFAASNEIPNFKNAEESVLKPLYDRLELKLVTEYVQSRDARLRVLKGKRGNVGGVVQNTFTLDELYEMQDGVNRVLVSDAMDELMDDILCELREKKIHVSDRKYFGYQPLVRAAAWLHGRDTVEASDMLILRHYLWTEPAERETIRQVLERRCVNPLKEKLDDIYRMGAESFADFESSADASLDKRIGKLRNEFLGLYASITALEANAQDDSERNLLAGTLSKLEDLSRRAHAATAFTYVTLEELHRLRRTV
jgi:MoxR-like ATPase